MLFTTNDALLPDDVLLVGEGGVGQALHAGVVVGQEEQGYHSSVQCCVKWHMP